jgi:hypothetical protein
LRERYRDEILRGTLLVDTAGSHVGQVNGLAVVQLGDSSFAHPVRITATARVGDGEVIDIEREVKLGGPIHSKGVLILSSFVASRFGARRPCRCGRAWFSSNPTAASRATAHPLPNWRHCCQPSPACRCASQWR